MTPHQENLSSLRSLRFSILSRKGRGTIFFLIPVFCLLAACGFHPVYGTHNESGGAVAEDLNKIAIDNIPERSGQMLRNDLIDRMYSKGRPQQSAYTLIVKLGVTQQDLGIQADATSTRTLLDVTANYSLKDAQGKEILKGAAHSVATFNKISDQYATLAAHDSAVERTVNEIAEQIVNRLSIYFSEHPAGTVITAPPLSASPPATTPLL